MVITLSFRKKQDTYRRVDISCLVLGRDGCCVDGLGLLHLGDDGRGRRPGDLYRGAVDDLGLGHGAQLGKSGVDN